MDVTQRFSTRVADYVKYRPGYPPQFIDDLVSDGILPATSVIADIGSGTGLLAKTFLDRGFSVIGVEPNPEMRAAGDDFLARFSNFSSRPGRAESTTLPPQSVDFVVAGQAFHWFYPPAARSEFRRILRHTSTHRGHCTLLWNERKVTTSAFLQGYEAMMKSVSTDYEQVDHRRVTSETLAHFFTPGTMSSRTYPNAQTLDLAALRGRVLSSSYAPSPGQPNHEKMMENLTTLFNTHARNGAVIFEYDTNVYTGEV